MTTTHCISRQIFLKRDFSAALEKDYDVLSVCSTHKPKIKKDIVAVLCQSKGFNCDFFQNFMFGPEPFSTHSGRASRPQGGTGRGRKAHE